MRSLRLLMPAAALAALLAGCASGPDPTQVRLDNLDARVSKLERFVSNGSLVQLAEQQDALQQQIRQLQGQIDDLERSNRQLQKQQHDLYADLDKRLAALGRGDAPGGADGPAPSAGASGGSSGSAQSGLPGVTSTEQSIYGQAIDALKAGNYSVAISGFEGFVKAYPASPLAPNAEYWLGEAHYVNQDYRGAEQAFRTVIERWPDSGKAGDAMLDLGNAQLAQGKTGQGRRTLRQLIKQFPGTEAATRAARVLRQKSSH